MREGPEHRDATEGPEQDGSLSQPNGVRLARAAEAERHRPALVACAERVLKDREEAEDVVQEVLLKVPRAELRDPAALRGWLFAVCARQALDALRARQRRTRLAGELPAPGTHEAAGDAAVRGDEARRLRRALDALGDPYKTALTLRYLEGRSFPEIAHHMKTLERTARTWVGRGLTQMRQELGGTP